MGVRKITTTTARRSRTGGARRLAQARGAAVPLLLALLASACGQATHTHATHTPATHSETSGRARRRPAPPRTRTTAPRDTILARLGLPPVAHGSTLPGYLMIADRDNNRVIVVSPSKRIVWRFPAAGSAAAAGTFTQPDDAFVSADGRDISTNQELADTIAVISLTRRPRIVWRYGHYDLQDSAPGYLAHPDDAYLLANGEIQIADIINCRVLWLNQAKRIVRSIGTPGNCAHDPPLSLSDPNGDTPLPDGGVLVTEIGGWVDRFDRFGHLMWSITTPTAYPSDAQLLPGGDVLVAGYNTPGRIDIITPHGRILWTYDRPSGPGALAQPSLAVALPNGTIAATDDWDHRVVLIDRASKKIVWQYGHDGVPGSGPGYLNKPDGLQLLP
jgi:hypothetical protein